MPSQKQLDDWLYKRKIHKQSLSAALLFPALISGNRGALSSAITLVESEVSEDRKEVSPLIRKQCSTVYHTPINDNKGGCTSGARQNQTGGDILRRLFLLLLVRPQTKRIRLQFAARSGQR
jgi:hypothetical protein